MKSRQISSITILLLLSNLIYGQEIAKIENIKIDSKELNQERDILIYTPQGYAENTLVSYDVIYVFDSQNREFFDLTHSIISFISNATKKYIVVGITSPYIEKLDYTRNNDLLPVLETDDSKQRFGKYSGNADNFLKYIKNEVISYLDSKYRIGSQRIAIGHSLSASFIIYSILKEPSLFNDYFAVSPNFTVDNERLVKELLGFDFHKKIGETFFYLSNANEGIDYWQQWIPARNKVYSFFENSNNLDKFHFVIQKFPDESHWSTFAPSLSYGLKEYFKYLETKKAELSDEVYEITINVKVPNKKDEVYVTGNQLSLGNWNPSLIKMKRKSDFERELKLKVQTPTEFKITKGGWDTEGEIKYNGGLNNILINPKKQTEFEFEVIKWADQAKD